MKYLSLAEFRIEYAKELISKTIRPIYFFEGEPIIDECFAENLIREYIVYLNVCGADVDIINTYYALITDIDKDLPLNINILDDCSDSSIPDLFIMRGDEKYTLKEFQDKFLNI